MRNKTSVRILRREKIKKHIRKKIEGTAECPRLVVFRSLKAIYAHLVDDGNHQTILTVSSLSKSLHGKVSQAKGKIAVAKIVGQAMGEEAIKRNIQNVVFDRSGYLYHGRVKALADGARESGLKF